MFELRPKKIIVCFWLVVSLGHGQVGILFYFIFYFFSRRRWIGKGIFCSRTLKLTLPGCDVLISILFYSIIKDTDNSFQNRDLFIQCVRMLQCVLSYLTCINTLFFLFLQVPDMRCGNIALYHSMKTSLIVHTVLTNFDLTLLIHILKELKYMLLYFQNMSESTELKISNFKL